MSDWFKVEAVWWVFRSQTLCIPLMTLCCMGSGAAALVSVASYTSPSVCPWICSCHCPGWTVLTTASVMCTVSLHPHSRQGCPSLHWSLPFMWQQILNTLHLLELISPSVNTSVFTTSLTLDFPSIIPHFLVFFPRLLLFYWSFHNLLSLEIHKMFLLCET